MSFFNQTKKLTVTTNFAGGPAYKQSARMELFSALVTSLGSDNTYDRFSDRHHRICDLIRQCDPEFVGKLAVYARTNFNVRTTPIILLVEMAKHFSGSPYIRLATRNTISRADELSEVLSAYIALNNRGTSIKKLNKLNNGLRRGISDAFHKFSEYQFAKYKKANKDVSLRDVFFLTHPKPLNEKEANLFKKIADDTLETPETWETIRSAIGQNKDITEEEKQDQKKESWEYLIDNHKLGYMATLRNLCNMLRDGLSVEYLNKVLWYLSKEDNVKKSKQFPYRFYSAYKEVKKLENDSIKPKITNDGYSSNITTINIGEVGNKNNYEDIYPKIYRALEQAALCAVSNIPGFSNPNETICIVSDVSGSMDTNINQGKQTSTDSGVTYKEVGLLMSLLLSRVSKKNDYLLFATDVGKVNLIDKKENIFSLVQTLVKKINLGYGTNGYKVMKELVESKKRFDKIYIFTDMQLYGRDNLNKWWSTYKRDIHKNSKLFIMDLAGYGQVPVAHGNDAITISGFSEKVFEIIDLLEKPDIVIASLPCATGT